MPSLQEIYSFDGTERVNAELETPDRYSHLIKALSGGRFIARGTGSSYVLASAHESSCSVSSRFFDRILNVDAKNRKITVEPGIQLGSLLRFLASMKLWLPAVPGHPSISVGGCVAFNVHGKGQFRTGYFGDYVDELVVFHPTYGEQCCSTRQNPKLFDLTIGGMGLTGFITQVTLRLVPLTGNAIQRTRVPVESMEQAIETLLSSAEKHEQVFSWHKLGGAANGAFAPGYIYQEDVVQGKYFGLKALAPDTLVFPPRTSLVDRGIGLLRNQIPFVYQMSERLKPETEVFDLLRGTFPIYGKEIYHRFFNDGLLEYQVIIPHQNVASFIAELEDHVLEHGPRVSLCSLKVFQGEGKYLNFSRSGICFAMDVPNHPNEHAFFEFLDRLSMACGGIQNISKDSRLSVETVRATYAARYDDFKTALFKYDPKRLCQSAVSERLDL